VGYIVAKNRGLSSLENRYTDDVRWGALLLLQWVHDGIGIQTVRSDYQ